MKRIMMLAAAAAAALAGCNRPAGPQTAEIAAPQRPLAQLVPEPSPPRAQPPQQPTTPAVASQTPPIGQADPQLPPATKAYTIRKNDTFWSLARRHLGSGRRWTEIARANPDADPNRLRIGQIVRIPLK